MTIAMMIDIETLSLRPDAYVTQVGYCVANLGTGEYLQNPHAWLLGDSGQQGRHKDTDTIRWWLQQDREVAASVFGDSKSRREYPLTTLGMFHGLVEEYKVEEVWASPAMFDLPILTSLWRGEKPWKYNQERCLMTLYKRIDPDGTLQPPPNQAHHDAAADAKWQMDYLINLHQFMRDNQVQATLPLWSQT